MLEHQNEALSHFFHSVEIEHSNLHILEIHIHV